MTGTSTRASINRLRLDAANPRLAELSGDNSQDGIIMRLWKHAQTKNLVRDILGGRYIAPPAMLGVEEPDGIITVVDGNRRLAAVHISHNRAKWEAAGIKPESEVKTHTEAETSTLQENREQDVLLFNSWDEAHAVQVRKHRHSSGHWSGYASALDFRRMLQAGSTHGEIGEIYSVGGTSLTKNRIDHMVNSLEILEHVNRRTQHPWNQPYQFVRLLKALEMPNIAMRLGISAQETQKPRAGWKLDEEQTKAVITLMTILSGNEEHKDKRHGKVTSDADIAQLNDVYENDAAIEQLLSKKGRSIGSVRNRMRGHRDMWEIKKDLEIIHATACKEMKTLKEQCPRLVTHAADLHVGHTSFSVYNDQSIQYSVHLSGRWSEHHQEAARSIERTLQQQGFPECRVTLL